MELQIQDLISSIKKEGIETAKAEAEGILAEAKKKAEALVAEAKAEAAKTAEAAKKEAESFRESARVSAKQAQRDAALSFKSEIAEEYKKLLAANVKKTVSGETLARLIKAALTGEDASAYAAEVAEVTEALKGELADEIRKGLEIRPSKTVQAGFRLAMKDGSGYFDCTDEEITAMLAPFFSELSI